jgi:Na+/H+ antiporter NhaB
MTSWNQQTNHKQKAYDSKMELICAAITAIWLTVLCFILAGAVGVILTILHNIKVIP